MADSPAVEEENTTSAPPATHSGLSDMQLHFTIVGVLFIMVIILGLFNVYIHFREKAKRHGEKTMASLGDSGSRLARSSGESGGKRTRALLLF